MWWIYVVLIQSLCFADILTATTALNQVGWSDFFNQQSQNHNMCENSRWTCWWSGATRPFLQQLLIFFLKSSNSLCNPADNTVRTQRLKISCLASQVKQITNQICYSRGLHGDVSVCPSFACFGPWLEQALWLLSVVSVTTGHHEVCYRHTQSLLN